VGDFEALLLSLDTNSTEQYITCLLEDEEIVKSLWQALDTIDRDIYLLMAEFGLGDVGNPGNLDELNFLFEKKQSLERMVNALREKADSTEARELAARLGGAESKRRLRSRFVELSTLEVALADLFSKTEGFVGQRRVRRELRSEPGARNPRREERRRPAAGTGPDERQRIPAGAALAPPPPARPLAERPIGAQRAAPLASPAIMMQEKLKAISGFNLARLLHNLADHNPRSSDDFLSFMCSRIRIFYDAILRLDPDQLRDPISPERRLGDVHYGHYAVDGTAITISLMPETTGEGRHPFAVASVARWISLEDQRRLGEAFVGYYDRFCSPENLQSLNDLATYLEEAVASQLPPSIMPLLTEHHFFLHAQFLGSRWPHRHRAFSENMRQRRVRYGNHSIEFHPVIIAAYSLSVSLRALCQHLRDYPLRIIHRYIIDTPPGARLDEEIRRRSTIIESHGLSIQEVMMFMTNLDDALHLIDPLRLVAPATGR
jgi:hypothetical protein